MTTFQATQPLVIYSIFGILGGNIGRVGADGVAFAFFFFPSAIMLSEFCRFDANNSANRSEAEAVRSNFNGDGVGREEGAEEEIEPVGIDEGEEDDDVTDVLEAASI